MIKIAIFAFLVVLNHSISSCFGLDSSIAVVIERYLAFSSAERAKSLALGMDKWTVCRGALVRNDCICTFV